MKRFLTVLCLLTVMGPIHARAFITDMDMLSPSIDGGVLDAAKQPVFNAVITAVSLDPGRTFKYYMMSDFNGWIFIDCSDALETGYRGGFAVHGFKKGVGNGLCYAVSPNNKLYGDKSLQLDNTVTFPDMFNRTAPPAGFYIACWENPVLHRYDIVVYNPAPLVDAPDKIISVTEGKGSLGEICRRRRSYFFHYRPESMGTNFTIRATGRGSDGTLYDRAFTFTAGSDYFNTGFISGSGGVVCLGKDDPARLEVPKDAYSGDGIVPVTISRTKDPENGTVYELRPALKFNKEVSFMIKIPEKATIESWDEQTRSWVRCEQTDVTADGTVRIRTRLAGKIRVSPPQSPQ